jgi:hypothetical protein
MVKMEKSFHLESPQIQACNSDAAPVGPGPVDIVTVPDFLGPKAHVQTAQTLLFLASWIEHRGACQFPLHVACIGDPPECVQRLAEWAEARISVHAPVRIHPTHFVGNKLRGFEIDARTDRMLLLDADAMILSDLSWLSQFDDCLAAAPDDCPKLTDAQWKRVYAGLEEPLPARRVPCLAAELGLPTIPGSLVGYKVPHRERATGLPYYNSGAVLAPWRCNLRPLWEESIRRIASLFPREPREFRWIHRSDQAGFAVATQMLQRQGWQVQKLPDAMNTRWRHLYAGVVPRDRISVLHLTTFLHRLDPGAMDADRLRISVSDYMRRKLARRHRKLLAAELLNLSIPSAISRYRAARRECRYLENRLIHLIDRYIQPVLGPLPAGQTPAPSRVVYARLKCSVGDSEDGVRYETLAAREALGRTPPLSATSDLVR